jgi:hypothetical protein
MEFWYEKMGKSTHCGSMGNNRGNSFRGSYSYMEEREL